MCIYALIFKIFDANPFSTQSKKLFFSWDTICDLFITLDFSRGDACGPHGGGDAAGAEFHDQGDAKWTVTRRFLWGHNNTPIGRPGSGRLQGVIGVF
jgi:hypothetical protein